MTIFITSTVTEAEQKLHLPRVRESGAQGQTKATQASSKWKKEKEGKVKFVRVLSTLLGDILSWSEEPLLHPCHHALARGP